MSHFVSRRSGNCATHHHVPTERRVRALAGPGGNMSESVTPSPQGAGGVSEVRSDNLVGGTIVAALGLALLGFSFYMPNTTMVPRIIAVLIALTGIATAMGVIPVRAPRDFYGRWGVVIAPVWVSRS